MNLYQHKGTCPHLGLGWDIRMLDILRYIIEIFIVLVQKVSKTSCRYLEISNLDISKVLEKIQAGYHLRYLIRLN